MSNRLLPRVGKWYQPLDKGDLFQVVALDVPTGTIEIQAQDGDLDELDLDEWRQLLLEEATQGPGGLEPSLESLLEDGAEVEIEPPGHRPTLRPARPRQRHH